MKNKNSWNIENDLQVDNNNNKYHFNDATGKSTLNPHLNLANNHIDITHNENEYISHSLFNIDDQFKD